MSATGPNRYESPDNGNEADRRGPDFVAPPQTPATDAAHSGNVNGPASQPRRRPSPRPIVAAAVVIALAIVATVTVSTRHHDPSSPRPTPLPSPWQEQPSSGALPSITNAWGRALGRQGLACTQLTDTRPTRTVPTGPGVERLSPRSDLYGCFTSPGSSRTEVEWAEQRSAVSSFQIQTRATTSDERVSYGTLIQTLTAAGPDHADITALLQALPDATKAAPGQSVINGDWGQYYIEYDPPSDRYLIHGHQGQWPDHTIGPQQRFTADLDSAVKTAERDGLTCTKPASIPTCRNSRHTIKLWPQFHGNRAEVAEVELLSTTPITPNPGDHTSADHILTELLGHHWEHIQNVLITHPDQPYRLTTREQYVLTATPYSWHITAISYFG